MTGARVYYPPRWSFTASDTQGSHEQELVGRPQMDG